MADDPAAWLIHEQFRRRVTESPSHPAVTFQGHEDDVSRGRACPGRLAMTFGELDAASDTLAAALTQCGIGRDKMVAVRMDRSPGMLVGFMAILKAGGAYVPIDPTHPKDRQEYVIGMIKAQVLLVDPSNSPSSLLTNGSGGRGGGGHSTSSSSTNGGGGGGMQLPPGCTVITLRPEDGSVSHTALPMGAVVPPPPDTVSEDVDPSTALAYVLFTSGSTGKPKGVCVQHRGVVNVLQWMAREVGTDRSTRILGLTTTTFDISVLELFLPLITGCTVHMVSSAFQRDPRAIIEVLATENIGLLQATPATYEMLMAVGWRGDKRIHVLCGGEAFRLNLAPLTTSCRSFRNVYGPTETTIYSTCFTCHKAPDKPLPIGEPISQTQLYILRAQGSTLVQCNVGEEGELYIGGVGLARGYFELPDMTASKFIANPFGEGRIYATGDVVVREEDGSLRYVGRSDNQVKIQGYRVELGEIEKVLQLHPDMATALVVARDGPAGTGGKLLVAYLKPNGYDHQGAPIPHSLTEDKVKAYLGEQLPPYMVPKHYVYVHTFQYTSSGKIDRKLLPDPPQIGQASVSSSSSSSTTGVGMRNRGVDIKGKAAPSSNSRGKAAKRVKPMTQLVMRTIEKASGIDVSPSFELQALRIDSLGTVLVVEQLSRAVGGMRIRPMEFFEQDTIEGLANHLHRRLKAERPEMLEQLGLNKARGSSGAYDGSDAKDEHDDYDDYDDYEEEDDDGGDGKDKPFDVSSSAIALERTISGLRGMLIIWVVLEHYTARPMLSKLAHRYTVNTGFFAVLSGVSLYAWWAASKHHRWGSYLFNKVVGVFPVYYLAILMSLPQYLSLHSRMEELHPVPPTYKLLQLFDYGDDWRPYVLDAALYLTAMQNYVPNVMKRAIYALYYASIQWNLYLYFPLAVTGFMFFKSNLGERAQAWIESHRLALWVFCLALSLFVPSLSHALYFKGTMMYFPQLVTGMALMGIFIELGGERSRRGRAWWSSLAWEASPLILLGAFSSMAFNPAIRGFNSVEDITLPYTVEPVVGTLFILLLMLDKSHIRTKLVEMDLLRTLGDLSYNIYLLNQIVGTYYLRMAIEGWPTIMAPTSVPLKALIPLPFYVFQWIQEQSPLLKLFALVLVVALSWLVQTLFIEQFVVPGVVWATSLISERIARRRRFGDAGHKSPLPL